MDTKKLALIHIVKRELDLSDQEYRDTLERVAGVRSAKDLDERGFLKLMRAFARSRHYRLNLHGFTLRQKMYIARLKERLGWDDDHFRNFLRKYYKKTEIDELTRLEASNLIESLKNVCAHQSRPIPAK